MKHLGPGFLLAGAAIGVSHLVQSTRAGAEFGWILIIALIIACITKYPFMRFGTVYTSATQKDLIQGYLSIGRWAFWCYMFISISSMFIITAAVSLVTAGLAAQFFDWSVSIFLWSVIVLFGCMFLLMVGRYQGLDNTMKIIISLLSICTLIAVVLAIPSYEKNLHQLEIPSLVDSSSIAFIVAFMGWMPIPIDASVWHSLWTKEKATNQGKSIQLKNSLIDFNIGYVGASIIAVLFFALGVLVMFGSGIVFSDSAVGFSKQLIQLYSKNIGDWSEKFIGFAAFITMLSTTLAVTDAYPRVITKAVEHSMFTSKNRKNTVYFGSLFVLIIVSLLVIHFAGTKFTFLVDFAAAVSFLSAPILAYFNLRLMQPIDDKNSSLVSKKWINFSWICLGFLVIFNLVFLYSLLW